MDLLGESCNRLLVSDKESGLVCVIRGADDLYCAGAATEWSTEFSFPIALPEAPVVFDLPDDASQMNSNEKLEFCWIDDEGWLGCVGPVPPVRQNCTDVAVSDNPILCSVCGGSLKCEGDSIAPEVTAAGVTEVVISDRQSFWLTTDGTVHWALDDIQSDILPGKYKALFLNDNAEPCGVKTTGELACTAIGLTGDVHELEGSFSSGSAAGLRVCLVQEDGKIRCFARSDETFVPAFGPEGDDFVSVVTPFDKSCALTRAGEVVCWNDEGLLEDISAKLN
jgi:hypothetical protein